MKKIILFLFSAFAAFFVQAQNIWIEEDFTSGSLPTGVTSNGSISKSKAADGVCSQGMIQVNGGQFFQVDVANCNVFQLNMKSTSSTARTVRISLKKAGESDYSPLTENLSVGSAAAFVLTDTYTTIKSSDAISVRVEPISGNIQIHDLYVEEYALPNDQAEILGFQLPGQIGSEEINNELKTITVKMPLGSDLTLVPSFFIVSTGATVSPEQDKAADFSTSVSYTVTSEDRSKTEIWTVNITLVESSEKEIKSFKLSDQQYGSSSFDNTNGIITIKMPDNIDISNSIPQVLTISSGATIDPVISTPRNFNNDVIYKVTAQDRSEKTWTVKTTLVDPGSVSNIDFNKVPGWASATGGPASAVSKPSNNMEITTTTGGMGGDTIYYTPDKFNDLCVLLYQRVNYKTYTGKTPLTIVLESGVYDGSGVTGDGAKQFSNNMLTIQDQGDISIIGKGNVQCKFGINVKRGFNIIIRNIYFWGYKDDAVNVGEPETHHVWIDHCTAGAPDQSQVPSNKDAVDGTFEVKGGASYVTVSWCKTQNHWKSCLIGHSDGNGSTDEGRLKVTHYANYYYNTYSRHPRVRFGQVHVLNNMYENCGWGRDNSYKTAAQIGMGYGCAASNNSEVLMEGNFFYDVQFPFYADRSAADFKSTFGLSSSSTGNKPCKGLKQINNAYDDTGLTLNLVSSKGVNASMVNEGNRSIIFDELNPEAVFNPGDYYQYTPMEASKVREIIPQYAGAGILTWEELGASSGGPTSITDGVQDNRYDVYYTGTSLIVSGSSQGESITVFNIAGILIFKGTSIGEQTTLPVNLNSGLYIVNVANKYNAKIIVK